MIALPLSDYLMQRAATWVPTVLRVAKAAAVGAFAYLTAKISTLWNKVFSPETHQRKLARESRLAEIRRQGPKPGVAPQQAACTPSISQGAMPSGPDGKPRIKSLEKRNTWKVKMERKLPVKPYITETALELMWKTRAPARGLDKSICNLGTENGFMTYLKVHLEICRLNYRNVC